MIADGDHGVMMLLKQTYHINMIDQQRGSDVKLTTRFFNFKDGIIHATDKTKIEVDDEVNIYSNYISLQ